MGAPRGGRSWHGRARRSNGRLPLAAAPTGDARRMPTAPEGVFPTFFLSGFECSTFDWHGVGRRDLAAETRHREHAAEDYRMLADLGIAVARESVPWPFVDREGRFDFSLVDPSLEAMNAAKVAPIW